MAKEFCPFFVYRDCRKECKLYRNGKCLFEIIEETLQVIEKKMKGKGKKK